jgi:hypothetical protein
VFCDFLNVWQQHDRATPEFTGGMVVSVTGGSASLRGAVFVDDDSGQVVKSWALEGGDLDVDYKTGKFVDHMGSFETSLHVRCQDGKVTVMGNPSAFGRLDNLFGVGLDEGIEIYNQVLDQLGLPPFTPGEVIRKWMQREERMSEEYTGAHITRVDCTRNLAVGAGNVRVFNQWAAGQKTHRSAPDDQALAQFAKWEYATVYLSDSKLFANVKVYDKSAALQERSLPEYVKKVQRARKAGRISTGEAQVLIQEAQDYLEHLAAHCAEVGVARLEVSYRARWFTQKGLGYWMPTESETAIFDQAGLEMDKLLSRAVVHQVDADDGLTRSEKGVLADWRAGQNVRDAMPLSTFYRLRSSIMKKAGHDIAARSLLTQPSKRPVYFQMRALSLVDAPAWYRRPAQPLRLAA